jgi:hypothetical protein
MTKTLKVLSKVVVLAAALGLGVNCLAKEAASVEVKGDSLRHLQELRVQNVKRLTELDQAINKKFEDTKLNNFEEDVQTLKAERQEYSMRQEFLNRLIFQLDTKYSGGDLRAFLERALVEMAKVDAISTATAGDGLWKFLKYSADAIHRLPEQKENILAFLEGYMNLSVSNPILPEQYLASRNYTNGIKSEQGNPMNRDEVGAIAAQRVQQQANAAAVQAVPAANPTALPTSAEPPISEKH